MRTREIHRRIILSFSFLLLVFTVSNAYSDTALQVGEKIYTQGVLPTGEFIPATIHGDIKITGEQAICASCHRKSGMGSSEGQQVVPSIAGNILFNPLQLPTSKPPEPPILRPAYDRATLKRALTEGIDAKGEPLDPFMPRYKFTDEQLDSLISYLNSLSTKPDPGVDDTYIHFATIVVGDPESARNKALISVFDAYIEQKNAETRHESFRVANAPWHKAWIMETYRKWKYHLWVLDGDSDTWKEQLEAHYQRQPVFAVINGVVDTSFAPVHSFCEQNGIPCLFPTTLLPTLDEDDFYTLYLNRGYIFEGESLASYLNQEFSSASVYHLVDANDSNANYAAYGLRSNLKSAEYKLVTHDCDTAEMPRLDAAKIKRYQAIVIHAGKLCSNQLLVQLSKMEHKSTIYLSTRLYGTDLESLTGKLIPRMRFTHSYELPARLNRLLARSTGWFKHKRILDPEQMEVQANAYFSLKVAGDALKHIRGFFFRDYFIEKIEHNVDDAPYTSIYPRVSLAPGQRFTSRAYYIAKIDEKRNRLAAITDWQSP